MRLKQEKGFTLIEVMVAISLLTFGILAVASMQGSALKGNSLARFNTEAVTWAQDELEDQLNLTYSGMASGERPEGIYKITSLVEDLSGVTNARRIIVTVTNNSTGQKITEISAIRSALF